MCVCMCARARVHVCLPRARACVYVCVCVCARAHARVQKITLMVCIRVRVCVCVCVCVWQRQRQRITMKISSIWWREREELQWKSAVFGQHNFIVADNISLPIYRGGYRSQSTTVAFSQTVTPLWEEHPWSSVGANLPLGWRNHWPILSTPFAPWTNGAPSPLLICPCSRQTRLLPLRQRPLRPSQSASFETVEFVTIAFTLLLCILLRRSLDLTATCCN